jgi:predicted phage terminase large subunit-like protein
VDPNYQRPRHIKLLDEYLVALANRDIRRLIVTMPPRSGKSETTTVKFPGWYLGKFPFDRVIISSNTASLALGFSMRGRNDYSAFAPEIWGTYVAPDRSSMSQWDVVVPGDKSGRPRGGLVAAGVGGSLTGHGAHLAIIDDPYVDKDDAAKPERRETISEWYRYVLRTRLMPGGVILLVQTRWHEADLAGELIQLGKDDKDADQWTVLHLPALAEEPNPDNDYAQDPLGRKPGEALWPEWYPREELLRTKASSGIYVWSALYQGRPKAEGGNIFQRTWFRYYRRIRERAKNPGETDRLYYVLYIVDSSGAVRERRIDARRCIHFQTIDTAATESQSADWFVNATWALTPDDDLLVLDVYRERAETTKHMTVLGQQYTKWRPRFQGVETKVFGINIMQQAKKSGLPLIPLKADTDKLSRSLPMAAKYERGEVYHPVDAEWLQTWEDELVRFPKGKHDDQVDTASYAGILVEERLASRGRLGMMAEGEGSLINTSLEGDGYAAEFDTPEGAEVPSVNGNGQIVNGNGYSVNGNGAPKVLAVLNGQVITAAPLSNTNGHNGNGNGHSSNTNGHKSNGYTPPGKGLEGTGWG